MLKEEDIMLSVSDRLNRIKKIKGQKVKKRHMIAEIVESVLHIYEGYNKRDREAREAIEAIKRGGYTFFNVGCCSNAPFRAGKAIVKALNRDIEAAANNAVDAAATHAAAPCSYAAIRDYEFAYYNTLKEERAKQAKIITKYFGGE